ncbi:hypothetical protein [Sphaerothrix gracilis]|uniref:hypothetical protein n=1 Tax=Sphaerothrix gracilis TaxID=3151835 RepID=UPI0031FDC003
MKLVFFLTFFLMGFAASIADAVEIKQQNPNLIECVNSEEITSEHTPYDLYWSSYLCMQEERFDTAAELVAIGNFFGTYDKKRVADTSSYQAMTVLMYTVDSQMTDEQRNFLIESLNALRPSCEVGGECICEVLGNAGQPTYYPSYMINHGIAGYLGSSESAIVEGFDPEIAWQEIMDECLAFNW